MPIWFAWLSGHLLDCSEHSLNVYSAASAACSTTLTKDARLHACFASSGCAVEGRAHISLSVAFQARLSNAAASGSMLVARVPGNAMIVAVWAERVSTIVAYPSVINEPAN